MDRLQKALLRRTAPWLFTAAVVVAGCKAEPERPDNLLGKAEMAEILMEVHLLEAKVNKRSLGRDSIAAVYEHYEVMMFEEMEVDTAAYNASIKYYLDHPTELSEIYEVVVDSLQVRSKQEID